MKQEKICISKSIMIFAAVAVFLLGFVVFTNYLNSQKIGQKPKADEPNPVHVPLESRKISCPVVGEPAAWKQTDGNPPTYYANTGVCAGSDDPAKVYDGTGNFQVCCNEQITENEYLRYHPLSPLICPPAGRREYSYGPKNNEIGSPGTGCYKINGRKLWEGTANQACGNLEMSFTDCCENPDSDTCQDAGTRTSGITPVPTVEPTVQPTAWPITGGPTVTPGSSVGAPSSSTLTCPPPGEKYKYKYYGIPGVNGACYITNGKREVDGFGTETCGEKYTVNALCCANANSPGCQ